MVPHRFRNMSGMRAGHRLQLPVICGGRQVSEWIDNSPVYHDYPIPEFRDNPLTACLTLPPKDLEEASISLFRKPKFEESERDLDSRFRAILPARLTQFFVANQHHVEIFRHEIGRASCRWSGSVSVV